MWHGSPVPRFAHHPPGRHPRPLRPFSAQLYMVMKASREHTSGGEGVVVLKNEPFDNRDGHLGFSTISQVEVPRQAGQYTLKVCGGASTVFGGGGVV